jgi:hypothetical protein
MTEVVLNHMPPKAPRMLPRITRTVIGVAVLLGAVGYGFSQIPPVHDNVLAAGRSLHVCSPEPPGDIQPFQSPWLPSGSTYTAPSARASALFLVQDDGAPMGMFDNDQTFPQRRSQRTRRLPLRNRGATHAS